MRAAGTLEQAGGPEGVDLLAGAVPNVANLRQYAQIVRDTALLRRLLNTTYEIQSSVLDQREPARELVERSVAVLRDAGIPATGLVSTAREDAVARRIVEIAVEERCAGIVLGSFRLRGLHRLTGRGVRERVLRTSHLPVVVAPPALKCSRRTLSAALSHSARS